MPHGLEQVLDHYTRASGAAHILLVVDQFEELFTLCRSETEQAAFVDNLLTAALQPGRRRYRRHRHASRFLRPLCSF